MRPLYTIVYTTTLGYAIKKGASLLDFEFRLTLLFSLLPPWVAWTTNKLNFFYFPVARRLDSNEDSAMWNGVDLDRLIVISRVQLRS